MHQMSSLIDQVVDQAVDQAITKAGQVCKDDARMDAIYASIISPVLRYTSQRMAWFVTAIQSLGCLIIVQTLLLLIVVREMFRGR
jgi:hypothetical protein